MDYAVSVHCRCDMMDVLVNHNVLVVMVEMMVRYDGR